MSKQQQSNTPGAKHSRHMRDNKKNMIRSNANIAEDHAQSSDILESDFKVLEDLHSFYKSSLQSVMNLSFGSNVVINPQLFSQDFQLTTPLIQLFYCNPTSIANERFTFVGFGAVATWFEGFKSLCLHAVHIKHHNLAKELIFTTQVISFGSDGHRATAEFQISTVNAILCGGHFEMHYKVQIIATFEDQSEENNTHQPPKMLSADAYFNTVELLDQLQRNYGDSHLARYSLNNLNILSQLSAQEGAVDGLVSFASLGAADEEVLFISSSVASGEAVTTFSTTTTTAITTSETCNVEAAPAADVGSVQGRVLHRSEEGRWTLNESSGTLQFLKLEEVAKIRARCGSKLPASLLLDNLSSAVNVGQSDCILLPADATSNTQSPAFIQVYPLNSNAGELLWSIHMCPSVSDIDVCAQLVSACLDSVLYQVHLCASNPLVLCCTCLSDVQCNCAYHAAVSRVVNTATEIKNGGSQTSSDALAACADKLNRFLKLMVYLESVKGLVCHCKVAKRSSSDEFDSVETATAYVDSPPMVKTPSGRFVHETNTVTNIQEALESVSLTTSQQQMSSLLQAVLTTSMVVDSDVSHISADAVNIKNLPDGMASDEEDVMLAVRSNPSLSSNSSFYSDTADHETELTVANRAINAFFHATRVSGLIPVLTRLLKLTKNEQDAIALSQFIAHSYARHIDTTIQELMLQSEILKAAKHYEAAILRLDEVLTIDPKYIEAFNRRAGLYSFLGNTSECYTDVESILSLAADHLGAICAKGLICKKVAMFGKEAVMFRAAIAMFELAISINPVLLTVQLTEHLEFCKQALASAFSQPVSINRNN